MSIITRVWYGVSVRKKRKYVDHFSKIDQSNTYAHIDVISRESVEKKTPLFKNLKTNYKYDFHGSIQTIEGINSRILVVLALTL